MICNYFRYSNLSCIPDIGDSWSEHLKNPICYCGYSNGTYPPTVEEEEEVDLIVVQVVWVSKFRHR